MKNLKKSYYIKFGENLQKVMTEHGKDVLTIASVGKIESKQVYRVLNGEHGANLGTILLIAKGLGVSPMELFDFDFDLGKE